MGLRPGGRFAPPPVPMLNIGAPPVAAPPLAMANGPPGAAAAAPPVNENAEATGVGAGLPAAFDPAEKLNAGGGDVAAAAPKIPVLAVGAAGVGVPNENGLTTA